MRKLISLLLALVMVMGLATVAFAYEGTANTAATIQKSYKVNSGTSPNAEFSFTIAFDKYENNEGDEAKITNAPTLTIRSSADATDASTEDLANKAAAELTDDLSIDLSAFANMPIGIYYYNITEVVPAAGSKVAGVTYDTTPYLRLKVTVYHNEDGSGTNYVGAIRVEDTDKVKTNVIENSYDSGKLTVKKEIQGNLADMDKQFKFTVKFAHTEQFLSTINATFAENDEANGYDKPEVSEDGLTYTFYLGNEETATFENLPAGTTYTVVETTETPYNLISETYDDGDDEVAKTIDANDVDNAVFVNEYNDEIDMGIELDSIPFVVMMVVCAAAAVLFVIKRRSVEF